MIAKNIARRLVRHRAVGVPAAALLGWVGAARRRARVLELCGYMPPVISVRVPDHIQPARAFRLHSPPLVDQIAWRLWTNGWEGFEHPLLDIYGVCARDANVVLDIGASSGLYALAATAINENVHVHAFEPLPSAFSVLRRNVELNSMAARVRIVAAAVADAAGTADFYVPAAHHSLLETSASLSASFRPEHSEVLRVPVVTVDEYVASQRIPRLDVMKVDVESQEHRVLAGAAKTLRTHRPIVFFEVLNGSETAAIENLRVACGYQAVQVRDDRITFCSEVRQDDLAVNQLLCPEEKAQGLRATAQHLGVRVDGASVQSVPTTQVMEVKPAGAPALRAVAQ